MFDDVAGHKFWPSVRAWVADAGIEPISDGEQEPEIWEKIRLAAAAVGSPLSFGWTPGELIRAVTALIEGSGGGTYGVIDFLSVDGQSNAVAADANTFQLQDAINDPRVLMWSETGGGAGDPAKAQKILPYSTPLLFESTNPPGVGPYVTYIQDWLLAAGPNDKLIVVCSARGGTKLHDGRWRFPDGDLSQRKIAGAKNSVAAMRALYPNHTIRFTSIWQQGESDIGATPATTPAQYKADVITLFNGFRAELASIGISDDIVLAGGMTPLYMQGYQTDNTGYLFEQAQAEAFTELPRAFFTGEIPLGGTAGDTIHYDTDDQRTNGHNYYAKRPRAAYLDANVPPSPGPISIASRTVSFKASNCALYAYELRTPPTSGSWGAQQKIHAVYPNEVGDTLSVTIPGTGDFDVRMVAISHAGASAYTNIVNYTTPSETLPTPVVDLDIENATVDGSGNITSIANIGSYGGSLVPESSAGTAALATVTRSNYGTNNKKTLDLLPAKSLRGSGNPMPVGSVTIFLAMFTTSPVTSNTWVRAQNDNAGADNAIGDIFVGFASSGSAIKAGVNSTTQQLLSSTALVTAGKNMAIAWVYDATAATWTEYINGTQVATVGSVPARAQRTSTQNYGYKLFGYGLAVNAAGIRGRVMAYREYNAALTSGQVQTDMVAVVTKFGGISWG